MGHPFLASTRTPPTAALSPSISAVQKRTLTVLLVSQVLSGVGLAAGVTVAGLLAGQMLHNTSLSGLPIALLTAGSAGAAVVIGRVSQRLGRRPGLAAGYLTGALGGAGVVVAAALGSPALLFVSLFLYGTSTVIVATTAGGIAGPLLATPRRAPRDRAPPARAAVADLVGRLRDDRADSPVPQMGPDGA